MSRSARLCANCSRSNSPSVLVCVSDAERPTALVLWPFAPSITQSSSLRLASFHLLTPDTTGSHFGGVRACERARATRDERKYKKEIKMKSVAARSMHEDRKQTEAGENRRAEGMMKSAAGGRSLRFGFLLRLRSASSRVLHVALYKSADMSTLSSLALKSNTCSPAASD